MWEQVLSGVFLHPFSRNFFHTRSLNVPSAPPAHIIIFEDMSLQKVPNSGHPEVGPGSPPEVRFLAENDFRLGKIFAME